MPIETPRFTYRSFSAFLVATCLFGCARTAPNVTPDPQRPEGAPPLELVESVPVETDLDNADIPDAKDVWLTLIRGARRSLDLSQFYVSNAPNSRLEPVIQEIEKAGWRGVKVRLLIEEKFFKEYPDTANRLAMVNGIEVRRYSTSDVMGGIQHAKYFIVDGREAFVGSQNFDWRALEHIQELGLVVRIPEVTRSLLDVFDLDWHLAGGGKRDQRINTVKASFPAALSASTSTNSAVQVTPVYSPRGWLNEESLWDFPRLISLIDGAKKDVAVQLLTYRAANPDDVVFQDLENALHRAAKRGVNVRLMVADWNVRGRGLVGLQKLAGIPGVSIRVVTIPRWSGGDIPYARVIHAKYLVVDGQNGWLGTSNWEESYFTKSRNVGLVIEGGAIPARLAGFFEKLWLSRYAQALDPLSRAAGQ